MMLCGLHSEVISLSGEGGIARIGVGVGGEVTLQ